MLETKYGMKYPFPHTLVHIVDNSAYTGELAVTVANEPSMYGTLVVAGFPMGEDRRVINIGRSDILNVAYGLGTLNASDIKKYGQTVTYPTSIIDQGAPVQLLRLTPDDATYAYTCLTIEWRWDKETNTVHVRYGTAKLDNGYDLANFQNRDRLTAYIVKKVKSDEVVDEEDNSIIWYRRAFIVNVSAGRGSAYNQFATAINQTIQAKRPSNVMYTFSTINTTLNTVVEQFNASLVNIDNKREDYIDPVNIIVGKRAPGSSVVVPYVNEDAISELYAFYRSHCDEMINDPTVKKTEYEPAVMRTLTINTFDPIFGLYIYGGTDDMIKLPWFQVDMRSAENPLLPKSNQVMIDMTKGISDQVAITKNALMSLTYGISNLGDDVYLGDIYVSSTAPAKNNPFLYVVAVINQYTGAVTSIRTNKLNYNGEPSTLTLIIEASTAGDFIYQLTKSLQRGLLNDTDTVVWCNTSGSTTGMNTGAAWTMYFVPVGTRSKAVTGALDNVTTIENTGLLQYPLTSFDFIDWSNPELTDARNLIGISEGDPAWKRPGALQIDISSDKLASGVPSAGVVQVQGLTDSDTYNVVNHGSIFKYKPVPKDIGITEAQQSVVGMEFDAIRYNPDKAFEYIVTSPVETANIVRTADHSGPVYPGRYNYQAAVTYFNDSANDEPLRFDFMQDNSTINGIETSGNGIKSSKLSRLEANVPLFPAVKIIEGYYVEDTENPENSKFYLDAEHQTEISSSTGLSTNNIFHDLTDGNDKWYWWKNTNTSSSGGNTMEFVECTDLTSESQIAFWYVEDSVGRWTKVEDMPAGDPTMKGFSGFTFTIKKDNCVDVHDPATSADEIHRYAVIGTIGSLYRLPNTGTEIPADYYSSTYGINVTSSSGGITLEDGSTGFFDDDSISSIEFKWRYSMLLVEAFRGQIDPKVMSPTRCPFMYLFDGGWNTIIGQASIPNMQYSAADIITASTIFTEDEKDEVLYNPSITNTFGSTVNKSIDVKQAMYDMMDYRVYQGIPEDKRPIGPGSGMSLHLDSGITDATTAQTINNSFRKRFDNPNASWDIGGYVSSADGIAYTYTKRIVDNLFRHCAQYSVNKPFVMTYSTIRRDEYISYFPDIDTTDWDYRELMYNSGGNSWIPDVNGDLMRRSQRTLMRGSDTSDLIQESNMRTLTQLVFLLQNKLETKLFEYNDDSILRTMQDEVNNMFTNWVGVLVDGLTINFERDINPIDGGEIVVCYVDVVFRGINLRIPIIVNVNRRVYNT